MAAALSWMRRHGPCRIGTRSLAGWRIVEVRGRFVAGAAEKEFMRVFDELLGQGDRRMVVDLRDATLADESVANAAQEAYRRGRAAGAEVRFVVLPGRAGGFYHMAGLEMAIPTFSALNGAIDI